MHYDVVILLTFHEAKDCLLDNVQNFRRYMPNSLIMINNGLINRGEKLLELADVPNVIVSSRSMEKRGWNMIPVHIAMADVLKEQNITSDYILPLSSNQLFLRDGFFEFMKSYSGGIFERPLHKAVLDHALEKAAENNAYELQNYVNIIGPEYFKYHSNHDSMFFLYEDFMEMMKFLNDYRHKFDDVSAWCPYHDLDEEYLYGAFLLKKRGPENIAWFENYSYWNFHTSYRDLTELQHCLDNHYYIIKRVQRNYDDPVRTRIRELTNE